MNQERIADTYSRALSRIEGSRLTAPLQPVLAYLRPFLTTSAVDWEYGHFDSILVGLVVTHSLALPHA